MHSTRNVETGTATVIAKNLEFAVAYPLAFLAEEFVALWNVPSPPPLTGQDRLRWRSADGKTTRYFRLGNVVPCDFPVPHVDLRVEEELRTEDELKARQDEIVGQLNQLAEPLFRDEPPVIPVPVQELFKRAERQAQRELLRQELGDIAAMLYAKSQDRS